VGCVKDLLLGSAIHHLNVVLIVMTVQCSFWLFLHSIRSHRLCKDTCYPNSPNNYSPISYSLQ